MRIIIEQDVDVDATYGVFSGRLRDSYFVVVKTQKVTLAHFTKRHSVTSCILVLSKQVNNLQALQSLDH